MPIERCGLDAKLAGEQAEGETLEADFVQELQSSADDDVAIHFHGREDSRIDTQSLTLLDLL
jgi:hypothetical protein